MKLDVVVDVVVVDVAGEVVGERTGGRAARTGGGWTGIVVAAAALCMLSTGAAFALDGIDLSRPAEAVAEGECPKLIQIKYPFLKCAAGEIGQDGADDTWGNSRRIPMGSDFVEGDGYFGPDLNRD